MKKLLLLAGMLSLSSHLSAQSPQVTTAQLADFKTWLADTFDVPTPFNQVLRNLLTQVQQYSQNLSSVKNINTDQLTLAQTKAELLMDDHDLDNFLNNNSSIEMRTIHFEASSKAITNRTIQEFLGQLYGAYEATLNNIAQYYNPQTTQAWLTNIFNVQTPLRQVVTQFTTVAQEYSNSLPSNKNLTPQQIKALQTDITHMVNAFNYIAFQPASVTGYDISATTPANVFLIVPPTPAEGQPSPSMLADFYNSHPSTLQGLWLYLSAVNNPELYPSPTPAYIWLTNLFNVQTPLTTVLTNLIALAQQYSKSLDSNKTLNAQDLKTEITQLVTILSYMVKWEKTNPNAPSSAAFIKTNKDACFGLYNSYPSLFDGLYQYVNTNPGNTN